MVYDRERERRDDAAYAEHKKAVAAGEKRILRRTTSGELHSYPADEIGFTPGRGQVQVKTWWGMAVIAVFAAVLLVFSVMLLLAPLSRGDAPLWGVLFLTLFAGLLGFHALTLARDEYRASQLRKRRGSPAPGTGSVDTNLLELGQ
jgi:hypothetical protein